MLELTAHHHVALTVADCDAGAAWYSRVLGFVELFREDGDSRRARVLGFARGGYSVGLVEHPVEGSGSFDPCHIGLDHLAFAVASRADLDAWAGHLSAQQVPHSEVIEIAVGAILNFSDLDGIALSLFWSRP